MVINFYWIRQDHPLYFVPIFYLLGLLHWLGERNLFCPIGIVHCVDKLRANNHVFLVVLCGEGYTISEHVLSSAFHSNSCLGVGFWILFQLNTKRTTGIPSQELMETTADDPLAMIHPSGKHVIPIMHWRARQNKKVFYSFGVLYKLSFRTWEIFLLLNVFLLQNSRVLSVRI